MPEFQRTVEIEAPAARVFEWHERPDAFARLTPPGEPVRIVQPAPRLGGSARAVLLVGRWPLRVRWIAEHVEYRRYPAEGGGSGGGEFTDVQVRGPFRSWSHRHVVEARGASACTLTDHVRYELPFGVLGRLVGGRVVRRKLDRLFDYRHRITREENEMTDEKTPADAAATPEAALRRAADQNGESVAELSSKRPVLLVFLRHLGCTFCREAIADLGARRGEIEGGGTAIGLVHMSGDEEARELFTKYGLGDVHRISDPTQALYRAMGLQRAGIAQLAAPSAILRGIAASLPRALGGGGHFPAGIKGDTLQMPGVFLIRDGRIIRAHRHKTAADRPDYCSISCEMPASARPGARV